MYDKIAQLRPPFGTIVRNSDTGEVASIELTLRSLLTPKAFIDRRLSDGGIFFHYTGKPKKWRNELKAIAERTKRDPHIVAHLLSCRRFIPAKDIPGIQATVNQNWARERGSPMRPSH